MKNFKLLRGIAIALLLATAIMFAGCMPLGIGCAACINIWQSSGGSYNYTDEFNFTDELGNYSLCEFTDENLGIGFKIHSSYYSWYYWGYVTVDGEVCNALFDVYGNGKTYILFSEDETERTFDVYVATVYLDFENGDIVCKKVESNNFNLNLKNLRMQYSALGESDFLPHEGGLSDSISDQNHILQLTRYNRNMYYWGKARTVEGGEIKTYNVNFVFFNENIFEIRDVKTGKLLSSGTYTIIDDRTATLKFEYDNLFGAKPFESYPYLTVSRSFYIGVL